MTEKINLKQYFAISIIIILAIVILYLLKDYLKPIFAAIILTILVHPIYNYLHKKTNKPTLSAALILLGIFLLVLIPFTIIGGMTLNYVTTFNLSNQSVQNYEQSIYDLTSIHISISDSIIKLEQSIKTQAKTLLPQILSFTSNFLLATFIMFFVIFYLLTEKDKYLKQVYYILPFSQNNSKHLLLESKKVIKAVLIGQVLTAIIQGVLGMISFFIAGINGAFFWGFIMIILSMIPMIGAFLIWLPAGIFLLLEGHIWQGIFVLGWGAIVVSQVDNIIRPKLVNKFADIHPLETFIGVFMGLAAFGMIGIIIGPLILSLFKIIIKVYVEEYGTKRPAIIKKKN